MSADGRTTAPPLAALSHAVALSGQMLEAARAGEWERLLALETQRVDLLGHGLAALPALAPDLAKPLVAQCLRLNDDIVALTRARIGRLETLLSALATERRAPSPASADGHAR